MLIMLTFKFDSNKVEIYNNHWHWACEPFCVQPVFCRPTKKSWIECDGFPPNTKMIKPALELMKNYDFEPLSPRHSSRQYLCRYLFYKLIECIIKIRRNACATTTKRKYQSKCDFCRPHIYVFAHSVSFMHEITSLITIYSFKPNNVFTQLRKSTLIFLLYAVD